MKKSILITFLLILHTFCLCRSGHKTIGIRTGDNDHNKNDGGDDVTINGPTNVRPFNMSSSMPSTSYSIPMKNEDIKDINGQDKNFNSSSLSTSVVRYQDGLEEDINFGEIMNYCNESFRTTLDFLRELNSSGRFPDESDKTPMVNI